MFFFAFTQVAANRFVSVYLCMGFITLQNTYTNIIYNINNNNYNNHNLHYIKYNTTQENIC